MHGQNGEDKIITDYLDSISHEGDGEKYFCRFLDVGAFHPTQLSNTRILVERGWHGVYVEPAPINFNGFLAEYRDEPDIVLVNAAIGRDSSLIEFYDSGGDALSTSQPGHVARWTAAGVKFRNYLTKSITWAELFDAIRVETDPISVLSLDVESMNVELFDLLPLERLMPYLYVIVVEHDMHHEKMAEKAAVHGFRVIHFNGENLILAR